MGWEALRAANMLLGVRAIAAKVKIRRRKGGGGGGARRGHGCGSVRDV